MRKQNWLAFLVAPVAFFGLLLVLGEYSVEAVPHPESRGGGSYESSVAVVWALDSIRDDVSCHDSLTGYERRIGRVSGHDREDGREHGRRYYRGYGGDYREAIVATYEDLVGHCDDHGPAGSARETARAYLRGMGVNR